MKRYILTIAIFFLSLLKVFSTEQIPDRLIIGDDTIYLKSFPLEELRVKHSFKKPPFKYGNYSFPNTGCWRGYVATWKIIDKKLMLIKVEKIDSTSKKLNIIKYFESNNFTPTVIDGYVFADWYTETLKRYDLFSGYYRYDKYYIAKDYLMYSNKKTELKFEKGNLVKNLITPIESYEIGDTLYMDLSYYRHWLLKDGSVTVSGIIKDNNGKMVRLEIISYGTQKKRIIKKIRQKMRYSSNNFWINPRYWKRIMD